MLVLSTGLENSSHEEVEDLGRVNPILGLKKKALQCEDVVEPEFFFTLVLFPLNPQDVCYDHRDLDAAHLAITISGSWVM